MSPGISSYIASLVLSYTGFDTIIFRTVSEQTKVHIKSYIIAYFMNYGIYIADKMDSMILMGMTKKWRFSLNEIDNGISHHNRSGAIKAVK